MPVLKHYWEPLPDLVARAESLADDVLCDSEGFARIVELGPGALPFSLATEFIGRFTDGYDRPCFQCDLSCEPLPYDYRSVDFIYSRHVLEDLANPAFCLKEIEQIASAGYLETPSAIAELCKGVDGCSVPGQSVPWRGYHHHRSIFWVEDDTLHGIAKYPIVEHLQIDNAQLESLLNAGPQHWNMTHSWQGPLKWKYHEHEIDYQIGTEYAQLLDRALEHSV